MAKRFLPYLALILILSGCGGGGGGVGGGASAHIASPFTGHWIGTWTDEKHHEGSIDATVTTSGSITFSLSDNTLGAFGSGSGKLGASGSLSASYSWDYSGTLSANGQYTMQQDGKLTGNLDTFSGGSRVNGATVTMRKIS